MTGLKFLVSDAPVVAVVSLSVIFRLLLPAMA